MKKLKRKKRIHYIKILLLMLLAFIVTSLSYAVITYNYTHEQLLRYHEESAAILHYQVLQYDDKYVNYTINDTKSTAQIQIKKGKEIVAQTTNALSVNFGEKDVGIGDSQIIFFENFRSSMTDDQYRSISSYLNSKPDSSKSKLTGDLRYELVCREYYNDSGTIYPKKVAIVVTNDINKWFVEDEVVKTYKLKVKTKGFNNDGLYLSGEMYRNKLDTDFVLNKYKRGDYIEYVEERENVKHLISAQTELHKAPFTYVFYSLDRFAKVYYSFEKPYVVDSVNDDMCTIKFADEYNVLSECILNILIATSLTFVFFTVIGFFVASLGWKSIVAELEREKLRLNMTRAMAHDLKTPIFIISGYAENLRESESEEEREHYTESIIQQADRMNGLIHNMLDFSRYESDSFQLQKESFSLNKLLCASIEKYPDERLELVQNEPCELNADRRLIITVIDNLIDNAVKYGDKNKPITIALNNRELSVTNGLVNPISAEDLKRIWEPYVKLDSSRVSRGNGLGLSISKRILELHGYENEVRADNDRITFRILFSNDYH